MSRVVSVPSRLGSCRVPRADYETLTVEQLVELVPSRVDVVLANSEIDVLRAAELRAVLGASGMSVALARKFRDKIAMKELLDGLPAPVVPFRTARSGTELLTAHEELGPLVVKPRDGSGSRGVRILRSRGDVVSALSDRDLVTTLEGGALITEAFIEGDVFHLDAALVGDRVVLASSSRYLDPPHEFHRKHVGAYMLDESSTAAREMRACAESLARRLGPDSGVAVLHLEFLRARSPKTLYVGEVACRTGGGLIRHGVEHTYDVNLSEHAVLSGLGVPSRLRGARVRSPTGYLLEVGGPPIRVPVGDDWLLLHHIDPLAAQSSSTAASRSFLIEGKDQQELCTRLGGLTCV
jgi:biotin carboxylase